MPGSIHIRRVHMTECKADVIVNPANNKLRRGSGLCGEIFREAGSEQLSAACAAIGGCDVGEAVITPGFRLKAKYIIHTVGPVWHGGFHHELQKLYCCYGRSLLLAQEHHCHSIVFPLLLTGTFNNPVAKAWKVAIEACRNFLEEAEDYDMDICFAIPDRDQYEIGSRELGAHQQDNVIRFGAEEEAYSFLVNSFPCSFTLEGIAYHSAEQYICSRKALLFRDLSAYGKIMDAKDADGCTAAADAIAGFREERWDSCAEEVVYHAVKAKFEQNEMLAKRLRQTGSYILAEEGGAPEHLFDGDSVSEKKNQLGNVLMQVRAELAA